MQVRMNKLIGVIVVLMALGSIINATAFKTAAVTNNMAITVDTTANAALAMAAATAQDSGITVTAPTGQLLLTLTDKMQPGSTYCFSGAFKVTNTGVGAPTFTFTAPTTTGLPGSVTLSLFQGGAPCSTTLTGQTLIANASSNVEMQIVVPTGTPLASSSPTLTINGTH
jgi:hypothetical protein